MRRFEVGQEVILLDKHPYGLLKPKGTIVGIHERGLVTGRGDYTVRVKYKSKIFSFKTTMLGFYDNELEYSKKEMIEEILK
jgi:hypothetical protein